ncbi:MAG TPA: ParB/RepB/Spo0J family partition protein [Alphaproteobacteria bacterium]|nr:ParB/RepB/Spo0J family partition protein [Alphaproteobacteria bacterium]
MNDKRKALGRGLDSLLPGRPTIVPQVKPQTDGGAEIAVDLIDPNPYQTRQRVNEAALLELTNSILANGVVQPVVVRPAPNGRFQLVAGERRWQACKRAGKAMIPAVVREISNERAMEITIIENLQREDLNPMEQARAFERLSREFNLTQEQIASRTGKDRASIANFIRLLKLPDSVQQGIETGVLSFGHGKVLGALIAFPDQLDKVVHAIIAKGLSVRQTEDLIAAIMNPKAGNGAKPAPKLDPNVREAQRSLERSLGVKVEITDHNGRGKIILKYGSLEDFDRIVEALTGK